MFDALQGKDALAFGRAPTERFERLHIGFRECGQLAVGWRLGPALPSGPGLCSEGAEPELNVYILQSTKLQRSHADATGKSGIKVNKLVGERVVILLGLPNVHSLIIRWILLVTSDCTALCAMAPGQAVVKRHMT